MKIYLQLFIYLVLPVLLLVLGILPLDFRGYLLATVVILTIFLAFKDRMSLKELGLTNVSRGFVPYLLFTLVGVIAAILFASLFQKTQLPNWWMYSHLQWAFLPISFAQEFVYRAVFQTKLQKVMKPLTAIIITSLLYSGMHMLWQDPLILLMAFFGGLAWGYLWYRYPNLLLITISHSILNFSVICLGFFPWLVTEFFELR